MYWSDDGRPAFRVSNGPDYVCSAKHPRMWGKDYWSTALLQALLDNGALTRSTWPETLATPEDAARLWPDRTTVHNYARLAGALPDLRVMLVFAANDHVQTAIDKPHIHQAYDGFRGTAGLWCRLNPDRAYAEAFAGREAGAVFPDNPANREPVSWTDAQAWGYTHPREMDTHVIVPLAAVAEMCDRVAYDSWDEDLEQLLHES